MTSPQPPFASLIALLAALSLSACLAPTTPSTGPNAPNPGRTAPQNAPPGTCWDKTTTPAVIETLTETVLITPAQTSTSGTLQSPPVYRTQTRPQIVVPRQDTWFEMVCPTALTPEFVASLQRALAVRDYYTAPVSARIDTATREAIARYQAETQTSGPAPGALTVAAAQSLGLWAVPRDRL